MKARATGKRARVGDARPVEDAVNQPISPAILQSIDDPLITELLTEQTRRCRKSLLLVSTIALAITWGGLFPDEINFQGIRVSHVQRANLLYLLSAIVLYFLAVFVVYCLADWRLRRVRFALRQIPAIGIMAGLKNFMEAWPRTGGDVDTFLASAEFKEKAPIVDHVKLVGAVRSTVKLRFLVDVVLPVAVGATAVIACVSFERRQ